MQNIPPRRPCRIGLTSIDVITGLVCLSVLASLAMPLILQMRSTMRSRECQNRLRQVCLAAHNYHDSNRRLPPATLGFKNSANRKSWNEDEDSDVYWKINQNSSSLLLTAVYMDLGNETEKFRPLVFDTYSSLRDWPDETDPLYKSQAGGVNDESAILAQIKALKCPEDSLADEELRTVIATQPCDQFESEGMDASRDIAIQLSPEEDQYLGTTNYLACMGSNVGKAWGTDGDETKWRGAMTPRGKMTFERINDGTSRTFMYGESLGKIRDGKRTTAMSWTWGGGGRINGLLPPDGSDHPEPMKVMTFGDANYSSVVGFGSKHDGSVNFALCDASCHEIKTDIDRKVLQELAGANDGGVPLDF